jgi:hypothetical protein
MRDASPSLSAILIPRSFGKAPLMRVAQLLFALGLLALGACTAAEPPPSTWPEGEYWTGTKSEYAAAMVDCLLETYEGVELVPGALGDLEVKMPDREYLQGEVIAAYEACMGTVPPVYWQTTEADFRVTYEKWIDLYDCMVEAGFEMSEPVPSFEVWWVSVTEGLGLASNTPAPLVLGGRDEVRRAHFQCHLDPEEWW